MSEDFVILVTAGSPFEAHTLAASLREHEIETKVLDTADADMPLEQAYQGVPVLVNRMDIDRARSAAGP